MHAVSIFPPRLIRARCAIALRYNEIQFYVKYSRTKSDLSELSRSIYDPVRSRGSRRAIHYPRTYLTALLPYLSRAHDVFQTTDSSDKPFDNCVNSLEHAKSFRRNRKRHAIQRDFARVLKSTSNFQPIVVLVCRDRYMYVVRLAEVCRQRI